MKMMVNQALCTGCEVCVEVCPHHAIQLIQGKAFIEASACTGCQQCQPICPAGALHLVEEAVSLTVKAPMPEEISPIPAVERQPLRTISWSSLALGLASQILPRAFDIIASLVENRLISQPAKRVVTGMVYGSPRRRQRRGRF